MTRLALRDEVRDTLSETSGNLSDSSLNRMILMGEQKLERDLADEGRPTPRQMLVLAQLTSDSEGVITLPSDWLRARSVRSGQTTYKYVSTEKLTEKGESADTEFDITYYRRLIQLTDTTSNWLYDIAKDLYIYATCFQYAPWNRENGMVYGQYYLDGLNSVCRSNSARPSGGMVQQKRPLYNGFYTIYGESMVFGRI